MPPTNPNSNTKQLVDIHDIRENVIILKNGSLRQVVEVSSINFDLKSNDEQLAIVDGFKNFLNSLDFPLQIVIHSRRLDINGYLERTSQTVEQAGNELLRIQGREYVKFVRSLVELSDIMSKKFYIAVPFYVLEVTDSKKGLMENVMSMFRASQGKVKELEDKDFITYQSQLNQRSELVMDGLQSMSLSAHLISGEELINMFSALYNPSYYG